MLPLALLVLVPALTAAAAVAWAYALRPPRRPQLRRFTRGMAAVAQAHRDAATVIAESEVSFRRFNEAWNRPVPPPRNSSFLGGA